tara:strand:- start:306 stop:524 length:219 start_codon:yes stop_codon:yes gene_type:complete
LNTPEAHISKFWRKIEAFSGYTPIGLNRKKYGKKVCKSRNKKKFYAKTKKFLEKKSKTSSINMKIVKIFMAQ